jgi:hypothetical protein
MYLMVIESMLHQLEEVHQATKLVCGTITKKKIWEQNSKNALNFEVFVKDAGEFSDFVVVYSMLSLDSGIVGSAWV